MICLFFCAPKGYRSNMAVSFTLKEMQRYEMTGENEAAIIKSRKQKQEDILMGKNDRFERVYSQGTMNVMEIWVDRETGVNYVFHAAGYAGGITPLLDRDGKPVVSPVENR